MSQDTGLVVALRGHPQDPGILKCVGDLVNGGRFSPSDLRYDRTRREFTAVFRVGVRHRGSGLFRWLRRPCVERFITRKVIVRRVLECRIAGDIADSRETLTVLFGLAFEGASIYLCSAEEAGGVPCLEATIRMEALDLEIHEY